MQKLKYSDDEIMKAVDTNIFRKEAKKQKRYIEAKIQSDIEAVCEDIKDLVTTYMVDDEHLQREVIVELTTILDKFRNDYRS